MVEIADFRDVHFRIPFLELEDDLPFVSFTYQCFESVFTILHSVTAIFLSFDAYRTDHNSRDQTLKNYIFLI